VRHVKTGAATTVKECEKFENGTVPKPTTQLNAFELFL
jgi:hypothetical protein